MGPILGLYGSNMDVPRWVPDESLLQNPHQSHMGCPYRTHTITHLGPKWVLYCLLAGVLTDQIYVGFVPKGLNQKCHEFTMQHRFMICCFISKSRLRAKLRRYTHLLKTTVC